VPAAPAGIRRAEVGPGGQGEGAHAVGERGGGRSCCLSALNIDDLAILRPKPEAIAQAEVVRAIQLAFSHVGKQYDFRFDNNT
jgi:hypothetical protein